MSDTSADPAIQAALDAGFTQADIEHGIKFADEAAALPESDVAGFNRLIGLASAPVTRLAGNPTDFAPGSQEQDECIAESNRLDAIFQAAMVAWRLDTEE